MSDQGLDCSRSAHNFVFSWLLFKIMDYTVMIHLDISQITRGSQLYSQGPLHLVRWCVRDSGLNPHYRVESVPARFSSTANAHNYSDAAIYK